MKILFVSSGNKEKGISPIVHAQGQSLVDKGENIEYFKIKGKGVVGYLKGVFELRKVKKEFDIIHAHYSLSGFVAALAFHKRIVVSLMGTDAYKSGFQKIAIKLCYKLFWSKTIVKTSKMKKTLGFSNAVVIPNGVDISFFKPLNKEESRKKINIPLDKKVILFVSNPTRREKNFDLAKKTVEYLKGDNYLLLPVFNVPHNDIVFYLNAADVLIITSLWEGSVNVVKEAMACNLPVVSTDVGDVKENTRGLDGYFVGESTPESLAKGILKVLNCTQEIKARERLIELGLSSEKIVGRLLEVYNSVL